MECRQLKEILDILNSNEIDIYQLFKIIPELEILKTAKCNHPAHRYDILTHSLESTKQTKNSTLKIALLLHDIGKPYSLVEEDGVTRFPGHQEKSAALVKPILDRLSQDEEYNNFIITLIRYHDTPMVTLEIMQEVASQIGIKGVGLLIELQEADMATHSEWYAEKKLTLLKSIKTMYQINIPRLKD